MFLPGRTQGERGGGGGSGVRHRPNILNVNTMNSAEKFCPVDANFNCHMHLDVLRVNAAKVGPLYERQPTSQAEQLEIQKQILAYTKTDEYKLYI